MQEKMEIIGLSGTNGSGKDFIGLMLAQRHGYLFVSVTDLLRDEAKRRGLPVAREHLREISAEWRREQGLGVLVDRAVKLYRESGGTYKGVVMASLRNPYEADRVHELGGTMVWIDADPKVRYERIRANAMTRGRAGEDDKTFEQFLAEEQAEMHASGDAATLDMSAVKDRVDITVLNNGDDPEALAQDVDHALNLG